MHNHTIVTYIQYTFQVIPFICYLVMAEVGKIIERNEKDNSSAVTDDTPNKTSRA